jgi:hypothetical protein
MSYSALRKEIAELSARLPKGYKTYDANGAVAVQSELDGLAWFDWAMNLLRTRGREKEKKLLGVQLARSRGDDNGGGRIYELFMAAVLGPSDIQSKAHAKRRRTPRPARRSRGVK